MNAKKKVILSAGGTGGHVYPALAIAKNLILENYDVLWIGTTRAVSYTNLTLHTICSVKISVVAV